LLKHHDSSPLLAGCVVIKHAASLVGRNASAYTDCMKNMSVPEAVTRRKRLKFRAWHRGMKEVDLVLGPYADAHLDAMNEEDLDSFEDLLSVPDNDLYDWLCERSTPPSRFRTKLYEQIFDFSRRTRRV